jgi:L-asparaginase
MLENKETGAVQVTDEHPLTKLKSYYEAFANVDEHVIFDLPSPHITPSHMLQLAKEIEQRLKGYDGVVVTHGTDTLEETAYFLDLMIQSEKPIIITGAMRSSNEIGSDALYNLITSLRVASEDQAKDKGVLVVMNDEIHTAKNVTKTSTSNVATFQSPQFGPIGIITKEIIIFQHELIKREHLPIDTLSSRVLLLQAFAGMDGSMIDALQSTNLDGLVIEAFGQGNLPANTVQAIQQMIEKNIPVVLVSRSFQGIVQPTYAYQGGGRHLKDLGVIFANGLTGPKARLKLLIALERTSNWNELKEIFQ